MCGIMIPIGEYMEDIEKEYLNKKNERLQVIEEIRQMIENDEDIPQSFCNILFPPQKREYELVFHGKESAEKILSKISSVPLQEDKLFPINAKVLENEWVNKLIFGENSQILQTLIQMKKEGLLKNADGSNGVRLIYIDPPFATRQEFKISGADQIAYNDKIAGTQFIEFIRKRLILAKELLSDDGSIFVHLDNKMVHYIKIVMDEIFGKNNFRNEIIWAYTGPGSPGMRQFNRKHDVILWYTKSQEWLFNSDEIRIPYKDPNQGLRKAFGENFTEEDIKQYRKKGMIPFDWWEFSVVARKKIDGVERTGYPTEKPQPLIERIIKTTTKAGDLVLDFFAGSGTTPFVSEKLKRRWIAIDVGKYSIYTIQKRLLNIKDLRPFMLYSGGLYDAERLSKFDSENWKLFALQLWGCQPIRKEIKGMVFDGTKNNCFVKVYTPSELKESNAKVSINTIQEINNIVGKNIGSEVYIIAPQGQFDFAEDDIEINDRVYHILRVPYSLLAKFTENFTPVKQPQTSNDINEIVDSVGFDFIQPPSVDFEIQDDNLILKSFKCNSRLRGEQKTELSMILIDYDYNGVVFDVDQVLFNNDLYEKDKDSKIVTFKKNIKINRIDNKAMFIFVDSAGNEKKVIINGKI